MTVRTRRDATLELYDLSKIWGQFETYKPRERERERDVSCQIVANVCTKLRSRWNRLAAVDIATTSSVTIATSL